MARSVTELRVIHSEPQASDVGDILDEVKAVADRGELSAVMVVLIYRDGTTQDSHSTLPSVTMMVGAMERAKHKLIREASE
jgi:hypothetical protein